MYRKVRKLGLNRTNRAKLFGVTPPTMESWDKIDDKEQASKG